MRPVHEASVNNVNYKYHQPKENNKDAIKGIMYEKIDKNTNDAKLKSGSNALEKLLMKARGYTALKESSAKDFLNASFTNAQLSTGIVLTKPQYKSAGKSNDVVSADVFHQTFENLKNAAVVAAINNLHGNSKDIFS
jgi:hypothetical protein